MKTHASVCVLAVGLLAFTAHAVAESAGTFQSEVGYDYTKYDVDTGTDSQTQALTLTRYFLPVDTADHPLEEAAFLEHASSVALYYDRGDAQVGVYEATMETVATEVSLAGTQSPYVIDLTLGMSSGKDSNDDVWLRNGLARFGLGWYATPGLLVGASFATMDSLVSGGREHTYDYSNEYGLNAKWVQPIGATNAIALEADYARAHLDGDSGASKGYEVDLAAKYYVTRAIGAGIRVEKTSNNEAGDTSTAGVNLRAFIADLYSVGFEYAITTDDDDNETTETVFLLSARF